MAWCTLKLTWWLVKNAVFYLVCKNTALYAYNFLWLLSVVIVNYFNWFIKKSTLLMWRSRQVVRRMSGQSSDSFQAVIRYSFRQSSNCHESARFVIYFAGYGTESLLSLVLSYSTKNRIINDLLKHTRDWSLNWAKYFCKRTVWSLIYFLNYSLSSYLAQSQILVISL